MTQEYESYYLTQLYLVTDAADCLIATYYYEAWCKIMLRKYQDAIDSLQEVLLYIERGRKTVLNKGNISNKLECVVPIVMVVYEPNPS